MTQEARRSMVWLEWIEIRQFRGVKPGTRLEFNPGFNVLLGRNGTGKTTLLELCAAVLSGDFSKFAGEQFAIEAQVADGEERLRLKLVVEPLTHVRWPTNPGGHFSFPSSWDLHLTRTGAIEWVAESSPQRATLVVAGQEHAVAVAPPFGGRLYVSFIWPVGMLQKDFGAIEKWLIDTRTVTRFDEGLGLYHRIISDATVDLFGSDEVETLCHSEYLPASAMADWTSDELDEQLTQDTLLVTRPSWLSRYSSWVGAERATLRLRRTALSSSARNGETEATFEKLELEVRFSPSLTVTHGNLSFGQKRLFAFIYLIALNERTPLIADELVNGLHHSWIQNCIDYLREPEQRQAILASQSPLLVDHLEFDDAEDTRRTFILCSAEDDAFQWRQMTESEADEFFGAYEVGIEHVGEILRNRGLW